jgi:cobalt-zinc-cadmium efflux system protein
MSAAHSHAHAHDHASSNERRTLLAALLTTGFMGAEAVGGLAAGSLALLADAAHMLTDAASLWLAFFAFRLARRPASDRLTYGFRRMQPLVAYTNGLALIALVIWIAAEAVHRLRDPSPVLGGLMLGIAAAGLVVNVAAFLILLGGERGNLNIRGALLHVAGDLLGSLAALFAAAIILLTGWLPADPLLSLLVAALLLRSAWALTREAAIVLLEGAPEALDRAAVEADLEREVSGVEDAHHVHVWSLTGSERLATLHVSAAPGARSDDLVRAVKARLREAFDVRHATVEIEYGGCADEAHGPDGGHGSDGERHGGTAGGQACGADGGGAGDRPGERDRLRARGGGGHRH